MNSPSSIQYYKKQNQKGQINAKPEKIELESSLLRKGPKRKCLGTKKTETRPGNLFLQANVYCYDLGRSKAFFLSGLHGSLRHLSLIFPLYKVAGAKSLLPPKVDREILFPTPIGDVCNQLDWFTIWPLGGCKVCMFQHSTNGPKCDQIWTQNDQVWTKTLCGTE